MAHIDTLKYYEELIKSGQTEAEARAHVYTLHVALNDLVTKEDLKTEIQNLENRIDTKFETIEKVGGAFCIAMTMLLLKIAIWP